MADLSWDEYFMKMAYLASERSSCIRRKVGAVAVNGNRILATGYNGVPSGFAHCDKVGCLRQMLDIPSGHRHEFCRGLHAEQNVLIQAAIHGINLKGSTLYCTTFPCSICCKMLIGAGFERVIYAESYPDDLSRSLIQESALVAVHMEVKTE